MNNEKENILIDPRSDIVSKFRKEERRKGIISEFCIISCTKMRSFSSVGSVGRFSPHLHPFFRDRFRFYSFIFSTSSSAISTVYIHIYILYVLVGAYLYKLGGLDYLKFRGGRLIGA